jgi:lycopene beta-cyclase
LLFRGLAPERAWHVFERFYRMPQELIERFYALELSRLDRARIVLGRPPRGFSIWRLLRREEAA